MKRPGRAMLARIGLGLLVVAIVLQVLPFGEPRTNPPVREDAPWPDPRARSIAADACYACHSNETRWPAYSYVAPFKWLVTADVARGRESFNFSDWVVFADDADDAAETVADGTMPPAQYRLIHPEARLNDEERQALMDALGSMDAGGGGRGRGRGVDDGSGGDDG